MLSMYAVMLSISSWGQVQIGHPRMWRQKECSEGHWRRRRHASNGYKWWSAVAGALGGGWTNHVTGTAPVFGKLLSSGGVADVLGFACTDHGPGATDPSSVMTTKAVRGPSIIGLFIGAPATRL